MIIITLYDGYADGMCKASVLYIWFMQKKSSSEQIPV